MKLLLDTHIWIWLIFGSDRLPQEYKILFSAHDCEIWLSPVSVWEAFLLAEKKINLYSNPVEWAREALQYFPVRSANLTHEVAMQSRQLILPHQDPADRFIAATSIVYDLHLVTLDEKLKISPVKYV